MRTTILLVSDIHGNYPALAAIARQSGAGGADLVMNCGDATVYAPFPNETLAWLRAHGAVSILGNTDAKVLQLLAGKSLDRPKKAEKRIMYAWTAAELSAENQAYLAAMPSRALIEAAGYRIGLFHGSPEDDEEFLFPDTPQSRFEELAAQCGCDIVACGHSHTPFHRTATAAAGSTVHFINPGSAGRMFDGNPQASYALLELAPDQVRVRLHRCSYPVGELLDRHRLCRLPPIYEKMYRTGRKLN